MKAVYENDGANGPGNGLFRITGVSSAMLQEGCRFSVRRSKDRQCLIPGGWQDAEMPLEPVRTEVVDPALLLYVDHTVVDQLDEMQIYRLTVIGPDGSREAGVLELSGVIFSPLNGAGHVVAGAAHEAVAASSAGLVPPTTGEAVGAGLADGMTAGGPVSGPQTIQAPSAAPRSWLARGMVAVLVLLLVAVAGWWWLQHRQDAVQPVADQPIEPAQADNKDAPSVPKPADKAESGQQAGPAPQEAAPLSPLQQARACLKAKCAPEKALTLSSSMPQTPEGRDAAFLLLGAAAEGGETRAMVPLARFYDPSDQDPAGSIRKDAEQARLWYAKAKAAGDGEAAGRLDALDTWMRQQADKGDAQAGDPLDRKP